MNNVLSNTLHVLFECENELIDAGVANEQYISTGTYYEINDGHISFSGRE